MLTNYTTGPNYSPNTSILIEHYNTNQLQKRKSTSQKWKLNFITPWPEIKTLFFSFAKLKSPLNKRFMKYIFVSGGVLSGLGKGVTAASLGVTLKARGYKVTNIKFENYLNLDAGNINPNEHGDVFLCEDGTEADLDLGTYERFLGQKVGLKNYATVGQIYSQMIAAVAAQKYRGTTVDAIPFIPEDIVRRIKVAAKGYDIILIELGGCAGEYQNVIYYEANRILKLRQPNDVIHVHVTYFPCPSHINELKSKPTQLSVKNLHAMGIQPDFIVGRASMEIDTKRKEKVAYYCNLSQEDIISNPDLASIYHLPLVFEKQQFASRALAKLGLPNKTADLAAWSSMVAAMEQKQRPELHLGLVAQYVFGSANDVKETYASLVEALNHAALKIGYKLCWQIIKAEEIAKQKETALAKLASVTGIIAPIGWGAKGVEGTIATIKYARENKIPFLGLGYGMHLAIVEYARHVTGLSQAHTSEVDPHTPHPVIIPLTMAEKDEFVNPNYLHWRLGAHQIKLSANSLIANIYHRHHELSEQLIISERHRHRFKPNPDYLPQLTQAGLVISGRDTQAGIVEVVELPPTQHPFFLAMQGHPEYKTHPLHPRPLFIEFLRATALITPNHQA